MFSRGSQDGLMVSPQSRLDVCCCWWMCRAEMSARSPTHPLSHFIYMLLSVLGLQCLIVHMTPYRMYANVASSPYPSYLLFGAIHDSPTSSYELTWPWMPDGLEHIGA